jgi:hypothetical protein
VATHVLSVVSCSADFLHWRWWYVPPKRTTRRYIQKMANFITTAVRTSDPTNETLMFVIMLTTENSRVCTLPIEGNPDRNLGNSPFRCFAFEYAHLWQGCRHVCQLFVIRLAPRVSWQIYLAWSSKVKLTQQSYTQLTERVFQIISLLSEHIFSIFKTAFRNPGTYVGKIHGSFKYVRYSTELFANNFTFRAVICDGYFCDNWRTYNINRVTGTAGLADHSSTYQQLSSQEQINLFPLNLVC